MAKLKDIAEELGVSVSMVSRVLTEKDRVDPEKRRLIQEALKRHNGNMSAAGRELGVSPRMMHYRISRLGIKSEYAAE